MRGGGGASGVDRAIALASRVANDRNFHLYPKHYEGSGVDDRHFGCSTSSLLKSGELGELLDQVFSREKMKTFDDFDEFGFSFIRD